MFKIGELVEIIKSDTYSEYTDIGKTGTVLKYYNKDRIEIKFKNEKLTKFFKLNEISLVQK